MVLVVQDVDEIGIERMDVAQNGELLQDESKLVVEGLRRVLDLLDVEFAHSRDGQGLVNDCGSNLGVPIEN
jgi:hypothetical protein